MRIFVIATTVCAVLLAGVSVIAWLTLRTVAQQLEAMEAEKAELAVAFADLDATYPPREFDAGRLAKFLAVRMAVAETYDSRRPEGENPEPLNPRLRLDILKTLRSELTFAKMSRAEYVAIAARVRAAARGPLAERYVTPPSARPMVHEKDLALVEKSKAAIKESMSGEWALVLFVDLEGN
jgi:hypothetical protein